MPTTSRVLAAAWSACRALRRVIQFEEVDTMLGGRYGWIQAVLCAGARCSCKGCKEVGEDGKVAVRNKADTESRKGCVALCARAFGRWLSALAIVSLLLPSVALAQSGFSWCSVDGPFVTGGSTYDKGYVVLNCSNANLAALAVIGRSGDYLQLTSDQLAKLSNESTGGAFYTLTSRFRAVGASGSQSPYYPSWWGGGSIEGVIDNAYAAMMVNASGGYGTVWAVETNAGQIASALEDYEVIYNGGNLGGGGSGGGGEVGRNISFYGNRNYTSSNASYGYYAVGTDTSSILYHFQYTGTTYTVKSPFTINITLTNDLPYSVSEYDYFASLNTATSSNSRKITITIFAFKKNTYTLNKSNNQYSGLEVINTVNATENYYRAEMSSINNYTCDGEVLTFNNAMSLTFYQRNPALVYSTGYDFLPLQISGPPAPPNNWPDPPSNPTPTPPTVPDPPTDTPVTQPTPPTDPTPPTYPITTIYEGDTYVVADIAAILDAMDEHCQHLQQAIYNAASDLYESLSDYLQDEFQATRQSIHNDLGWLVGCIHDEFQGLMDYLQELFDWLADQFSFTYSGGTYNDSSVISWLRMIYLKLGNGGGNTRPVDPVSDPFGIGKWLNDLWAGFLAALLGIGANGIGAVTSGMQTLTTKFPFSVPWDIAALLTLLVTQPVAPVVHVPQFAVDSQYGLVQLQDMTIDLSVYDTYWVPVRLIEKIAFAVFLATQTKDMLELLGSALVKEC